MKNTENSAWHRVDTQHMLPIVILLSLCQVYPWGHATLSGTCGNGLYLSQMLFLFPVIIFFLEPQVQSSYEY